MRRHVLSMRICAFSRRSTASGGGALICAPRLVAHAACCRLVDLIEAPPPDAVDRLLKAQMRIEQT